MKLFLLSLLLIHAAGCAPVLRGPLDSARPEQAAATLDHGYSLLHQVLHEESSVTLIFALKKVSEPIETLVRQVGDAAASGERSIRKMAVLLPPVAYNSDGLPLIEVSTRHHIANQLAKSLLLAGDSFELQLLLTQQNACVYISALASTLATAESNAERSAMLTALARDFTAFKMQLVSHLSVRQPKATPQGSSQAAPK
jgi:hypothetical protein